MTQKQIQIKILSVVMTLVVLMGSIGFSIAPALASHRWNGQGSYYSNYEEDEDDEQDHEYNMMGDSDMDMPGGTVSTSVNMEVSRENGMHDVDVEGRGRRRYVRRNNNDRGEMDNERMRNRMRDGYRRGEEGEEVREAIEIEKRGEVHDEKGEMQERSRFSFFGFFRKNKDNNTRRTRGVRVQFNDIRRGIGQEIRKECEDLTGEERAQCVVNIVKEFRNDWLKRIEERVEYLERFAKESRVLTNEQRKRVLEEVRRLKEILQDAKKSEVDPKEVREQIRAVRQVVLRIRQDVRKDAYLVAKERMENTIERATQILRKYEKYLTAEEKQEIEHKLDKARALVNGVDTQMSVEDFKDVVKEFRKVMLEVKELIKGAVLSE